MLSKIFNISANSDFKHSKNPSKTSRFLHVYRTSELDIQDKADFSPPLQFIKNVNWQLKNFQEDSIGVIISFSTAGIDFEAKFPFNNFEKHTIIDYKVSKIDNEKLNRGEINFMVDYYAAEDLQIEPLELKNLNTLFNRLFEFNAGMNIKSTERSIINSLFEENQQEVYGELNQINNYLIIFLGKINPAFTKNIVSSEKRGDILFKEAVVTKV